MAQRGLAILLWIATALAALDFALNVLAVPWLLRLRRDERRSGFFQAACGIALALELAVAFVLTAMRPLPLLAIAALAALALYKFALVVLAP
jgi:hypothetical protein